MPHWTGIVHIREVGSIDSKATYIAYAAGRTETLQEILKHEPLPVPLSIAEISRQLRIGTKSILMDALSMIVNCTVFKNRMRRHDTSHKWGRKKQNQCHCCSRVAMVAKWRHRGRGCHRSVHTAWVWGCGEGTSEAEASPGLREWALQQNAFITWRPLADHCASILQLQQWHCVAPVSFERPLSDKPPLWLFWTRSNLGGDHDVHGDCWTSCASSLKTKVTMLPPLRPQRWLGQFYGRTREAQKSQALCKWGISDWWSGCRHKHREAKNVTYI